jgi:hypothetical protein
VEWTGATAWHTQELGSLPAATKANTRERGPFPQRPRSRNKRARNEGSRPYELGGQMLWVEYRQLRRRRWVQIKRLAGSYLVCLPGG